MRVLYAPTFSCCKAKDWERLEAAALAAGEEPLPELPAHGSSEGFEHDRDLLAIYSSVEKKGKFCETHCIYGNLVDRRPIVT